jgi:hypothetical protein
VKPDALDGLRKELLQGVENWRRDWESLDVEKYLGHYAPGFSSGKQGFAAWAQQKRQVNAAKTMGQGQARPGQRFSLSGTRGSGRGYLRLKTTAAATCPTRCAKRQYWINEKGGWRILHEGGA